MQYDSMADLEKLVGPDGWNLAGKMYPTTRLRAACINTILRDEILELSLSRLQHETTSARVRYVCLWLITRGMPSQSPIPISFTLYTKICPDSPYSELRDRLVEVERQLPATFKITLDKGAFTKHGEGLAAVITNRLHRLHSQFLIERIEHFERDERRLLDAARDMLSIVVLFWSER